MHIVRENNPALASSCTKAQESKANSWQRSRSTVLIKA
uniref:Uncharacterized protein n=1 Tax=Anguilla anguilla TaxID=7936 RepID=A0A0E9XQV0_ANGAN